jgi:integrase/recombinase XerD
MQNTMIPLTLQPIFHRGAECIALHFAPHAGLQNLLKTNAGARWSKTHRCWWLILSKENYDRLHSACHGIATLDTKALSIYLASKKQTPSVSNTIAKTATPVIVKN